MNYLPFPGWGVVVVVVVVVVIDSLFIVATIVCEALCLVHVLLVILVLQSF